MRRAPWPVNEAAKTAAMKFDRPLNIILLLSGMLACSATLVAKEEACCQFVGATSQEWVAGVPGGGRSIAYTFTLRITTPRKLVFDSVWVADRRLPLLQDKDAAPVANAGRIITLRASQYAGGGARVGNTEEVKADDKWRDTAKAPVKYTGAALLRYRVEGAKQYFVVPEISPLPTLYGQ